MAPPLQAFLLSRLLTAGFAQDTKGLGSVELHCRLPSWTARAPPSRRNGAGQKVAAMPSEYGKRNVCKLGRELEAADTGLSRHAPRELELPSQAVHKDKGTQSPWLSGWRVTVTKLTA